MAGLGRAEEAVLEFSLAGSRDVAWLVMESLCDQQGYSLWEFCCSDTCRTSGILSGVFFFPQYLKLEVFRTFKKLFLAKIIEHLSECVSKPIP